MSGDASWYQRKFAQARGQQPAPQQRPPQQWGGQPQQFVQPQPQPQQMQTAPPKVTMDNLWDSMQFWRGGKAHRIDAQPCPHCGSDKYYSRTGDGPRRGPPPAPHCFECGFNGMFEQGLATSWGGV